MILGVLGGSFDPFHAGHLAMAEAVLERGLATRLVVVPAARSPHKARCAAPATDRLAMARAALAGLPAATVSDREVRRGGTSYTVATLEELAGLHPGARLRLVIGADNLPAFATWRAPERILELAEIVVFARPGSPLALPPEMVGRVLTVPDLAVPVSATEVRALVAAGGDPADLVPPAVRDYIVSHGLYRTPATPARGEGAGED
jgi:nicotinate-nucleotide adenylyltransferase